MIPLTPEQRKKQIEDIVYGSVEPHGYTDDDEVIEKVSALVEIWISASYRSGQCDPVDGEGFSKQG